MILQREGVRESIHHVDPLRLETRLCITLHCQQYNIASPNVLWHIDTPSWCIDNEWLKGISYLRSLGITDHPEFVFGELQQQTAENINKKK